MATLDNDIPSQDPKHEPEAQQLKFLARVTSLPFVQLSVSTIEHFTIGRLVLETANTTLVTAQKYQPRVIQPYISRADDLACQSLDLLASSEMKAYLPKLEAPLRSIIANIQTLQQQSNTKAAQLTSTIATQLQAMIEYVKNHDVIPDWLKTHVVSMLDVAVQHYERLREEYSQLNPVDRARKMTQGIQERVLPILNTVQSHLRQYTEKPDVKPTVVTSL